MTNVECAVEIVKKWFAEIQLSDQSGRELFIAKITAALDAKDAEPSKESRDQITSLEQKLAIAREALEFYGDDDNLNGNAEFCENFYDQDGFVRDRGQRAREALKILETDPSKK